MIFFIYQTMHSFPNKFKSLHSNFCFILQLRCYSSLNFAVVNCGTYGYNKDIKFLKIYTPDKSFEKKW